MLQELVFSAHYAEYNKRLEMTPYAAFPQTTETTSTRRQHRSFLSPGYTLCKVCNVGLPTLDSQVCDFYYW